jgi:serine/threonine-protein kinase
VGYAFFMKHGPRPDETMVSADTRSILDDLATGSSDAWPPSAPLKIAEGERIGRYRLLREIGHGAFGVVFEAHDSELGRRVALKVTRIDRGSSSDLDRFRAEAAAVARLNHPNVVTLFDFGVVAGLPYLVLELLQGETLQERIRHGHLDRAQSIAIATDVARGLGHAHVAGLVHRDLKPGNIFITSDGRAKILDFGLARPPDGPGAAPASSLVGTPRYMAPEQWRGEPVDARADVFAFGVILYQLLAKGALPFALVDGVSAVVDDCSVPPRLVGVPDALARVVERSLAKVPAARFADGGELLAALLAATPRRARGRRWLIAAGLVAAVALGGSVVREVRARRDASRRARVAQRVGQEVERLAAELRYAYLQPLHDVRPDEQRAHARLAALSEEVTRAGDYGEGAGEYVLGRASLALHDAGRAIEHLEAAWRRGYREPDVSLALGQALGERYVLQRGELDGYTELPPSRDRVAALAQLKEADQPAYARGLAAFYEGRDPDALELAGTAEAEAPWRYEAIQLAGDVRVELAWDHYIDGEPDVALTRLARAGEDYARALSIARSDPSLYLSECSRRKRVEQVHAATGKPCDFGGAIAACDQAVAANPDLVEAHHAAAIAFILWAEHDLRHGLDPRALVEAARARAARAMALDPRRSTAYRMLADADQLEAEHAEKRGEDQRPFLQAAAQAGRIAVALDTGNEGHEQLGMLYWLLAEAEESFGDDPRPSLAQAIAMLEPLSTAGALETLADAWMLRGGYDAWRGDATLEPFDRAIEYATRAVALEPGVAPHYRTRADALHAKSNGELLLGHDPLPLLESAAADYEKAVALAPAATQSHVNFGLLSAEQAARAFGGGRDSGPLLARARAELEAALRIDPKNGSAWHALASTESIAAEQAIDSGHDPTPSLRAGRAAMAHAAGEPRESDAAHADLETIAGRWSAEHQRSPEADYARAEALYDRAIGRRLDDIDKMVRKAELLFWRATWKLDTKRDASRDLTEGLRLCDDALGRSAKFGYGHATRGALLFARARTAPSPAAQLEDLRAAVAAFERALACDGMLGRAYQRLLTDARARVAAAEPH